MLPSPGFEECWIHHWFYLCSLWTTQTFPALTANCAETHKTEQQQRGSRDVQFTANKTIVIKQSTKLDELLNRSSYAIAWKSELYYPFVVALLWFLQNQKVKCCMNKGHFKDPPTSTCKRFLVYFWWKHFVAVLFGFFLGWESFWR